MALSGSSLRAKASGRSSAGGLGRLGASAFPSAVGAVSSGGLPPPGARILASDPPKPRERASSLSLTRRRVSFARETRRWPTYADAASAFFRSVTDVWPE